MIFKQATRNFSQNKVTTAAIIFTVALCCVMLFLSFIYSQIIQEEFRQNIPVEAENAVIRIEYTPQSRTRIITISPHLDPYMDDIEFTVGALDIYGVTKIRKNTFYINLIGLSFENLNKINNLEYIEEEKEKRPAKDDIIISQKTAEELGLSLGNSILIRVGQKEKRFYVAKIAHDHPCFERAGVHVIYGVESFVSDYFPGGGYGNFYNKIYIKPKDHISPQALIDKLSRISAYKGYDIRLETDVRSYDQTARDIALPLTIASVGCVVMVLILIFLIVNSRIKKQMELISKLKSVGADNGYIFKVFALEGLFYIVLGVLLGVAANLYLFYKILPLYMNINLGNDFYIKSLILSSLSNAVVIFLLFIYPIWKSKNVSVRKTYVSSKNTLWKGNKLLLIFGTLAVGASVPLVVLQRLNPVRGLIAFILLFIGTVIIIPYVVQGVFYLLERFSKKSVSFIAFRNLRQEKAITNNLRILFSAIIVCSILISAASLTSSLLFQVISDVDCDIIIENVKGETAYQKNKVLETDGVYDVYCYYYEKSTMSIGKQQMDVNIIGISPDDFDFMQNTGDLMSREELIKVLNKKDGMLLDFMYHKVYGIEIGDKLSVEMNGILQDIEVKAFYNSYQYGGRTLVIHSELMNDLFNLPLYDTIVLKNHNNVDETVMVLRAELGDQNVIVINKNALFGVYVDILEDTLTFAYLFSFFIMAVCLFGVFTNIVNSREERKMAYYQLYSLGMDKWRIMGIELIENLFVAVFCGIFALLTHFIFSLSISNILAVSRIYIPTPMSFLYSLYLSLFFGAGYVLFALSGYFSVKSKKAILILKYN